MNRLSTSLQISTLQETVKELWEFKGAMRCLRSHSSFISACNLFGPQENHNFFIANVTNAGDKLCKHAAWETSCWKG